MDQLLSHPHLGVETSLLRHVPEAEPILVGDDSTLPTHLAGVGSDQTEDAPHGRRLPGTVRSQKPQDASWSNRETGAGQSDNIAVSLLKCVYRENGCLRTSSVIFAARNRDHT